MKEITIPIIIFIATGVLGGLATLFINLLKKWLKQNITAPIQALQTDMQDVKSDVKFLKLNETITQDYLMEKNGFGDFKEKRIEALNQDYTLKNLVK